MQVAFVDAYFLANVITAAKQDVVAGIGGIDGRRKCFEGARQGAGIVVVAVGGNVPGDGMGVGSQRQHECDGKAIFHLKKDVVGG